MIGFASVALGSRYLKDPCNMYSDQELPGTERVPFWTESPAGEPTGSAI